MVEQDEKYDGLWKNEGQMRQFRETLTECDLTDLGYRGSRFTSTNCHHNGCFIRERLDRVVSNAAWCSMHRQIDVKTIASCTSDHKSLFLQLFGTEHARVFFKKSFKVEASWMHNEGYNDIVAEAWRDRDNVDLGASSVAQKLASCQSKLSNWSSRKFGNAKKELKKKTKRLEEL